MKVFRRNGFKDIKNIALSVVLVFICLVSVKVNAKEISEQMKTFDVPLTMIQEIYKNQQSTKYKLTASCNIYKITDESGSRIIPEQLSKKSVLFSSNGAKKVRVYSNDSNYEMVDLEGENVVEDVTPPNVLWKYKSNGEDIIWLEVEDESGLYEIKGSSQGESMRTLFTDMQKRIVMSFEMGNIGNIENLEVSDVFGNVRIIGISDITLSVVRALKNVNGSSIMLELNDSQNNITGLEYLDGTAIEMGSGADGTYNVLPGTTKIKVKFDNGEYAIIQLDTDTKSPEIVRIWRKDDDSRILLEAKDYDSGVKKVAFYNKSTKYEEVCKEFEGVQVGGVLPYDVMEGATHLYIYDGVGNRTKLAIDSIDIDDEKPTIVMKYENGQYVMIVNEHKSGLEKVEIDGIAVDTYIDYPVGEFVYTFNDLDGNSRICACDGVGDVVNLTVDEAISARRRIYKNSEGNLISISIVDDRGIRKITDQDGHAIERTWLNGKEIEGVYKVRDNIDSIKVFYERNKSYSIKLQELSEEPQVSEKVYDGELITECVVSSKAGIRKIEYQDGKNIVFKKDMPDDIIVNCTKPDNNNTNRPVFVTVYDALGNSIKINESLV